MLIPERRPRYRLFSSPPPPPPPPMRVPTRSRHRSENAIPAMPRTRALKPPGFRTFAASSAAPSWWRLASVRLGPSGKTRPANAAIALRRQRPRPFPPSPIPARGLISGTLILGQRPISGTLIPGQRPISSRIEHFLPPLPQPPIPSGAIRPRRPNVAVVTTHQTLAPMLGGCRTGVVADSASYSAWFANVHHL